MPKIITINRWLGMKENGSYFSMGFQPAFMGDKRILRQEWQTTAQDDPNNLVVGFCNNTETGLSYTNDLVLYYIDNNGDIYKGQSYILLNNNAKKHDIQTTKSDLPDIQKSLAGNIIYTSAQYLGRRLTGTDNSAVNNKTTSMVDTTSNFTTLGVQVGATLYNTTDKCKGLVTSISTTTNANDTLNCSAGFTGGTDNDFDNGDGYAVWADGWKDLGASQPTWSRQIFFFEDLHLIGNGNYLATIDSADANFNASYKQLRVDWSFQAGAANGAWLTLAANKQYKGAIMFWDGWSSGWDNTIYLDNEINTIKPYGSGWIFNSGAEIFFTNGYVKTLISKFPDLDAGLTMGLLPNSLLILGNKAIFNYNGFLYGRAKMGLWVLDILTGEWVFVPNSYQSLYNNSYPVSGGIFFDPKHNKIYFGYTDNTSAAAYRVDLLEQNYRAAAPDESVVVLPVNLGAKEKQISKIEIDWAKTSLGESIYDAQSVDITVSVGSAKKHFWGYGQANAVSTAVNTVKIDNSVDGYTKVAVGDEILMLRYNNRGERAFISSISGAKTSSCVLTLDRGLTNNTENSSLFNIFPLRKAKGKNTYTDVEMAVFYPDGFLSSKAIIEIWVNATSFPIQIEEVRIFITD